MRSLVAALLVAQAAYAAPPPDPATTRAKELFTHAEALYALTRYAEALAEYEKAFETKPLPGFLFNIGQCHRQLGHWEKAAYFYRTYLEKQPDARNRDLVKSLIAEMEDNARKQPPGKRVDSNPLAPPPEPPPRVETNPPPRLDLKKQPDEPAPFYRRWYVLAGAAAIVVVVVVAIVLGATIDGSAPTGSLTSINAR